MGRQVVHDDNVAGRERWNENLLDIGREHRAIHGPVIDKGRRHPGQTQSASEGCRLPVSVRYARSAALTA